MHYSKLANDFGILISQLALSSSFEFGSSVVSSILCSSRSGSLIYQGSAELTIHLLTHAFVCISRLTTTMDDLTQALSANFAVSKEANSTAAPHPRMAQYKTKFSVLEQSERRRRFLDLQKTLVP